MLPRRALRALLAAALLTFLTGCGQTHTLPTVASESGWCREVGYNGVLRGDPDDPRLAWGEAETRTNQLILRTELIWPPGYTARFTPEVAILDSSRQVRYVAGDRIKGGCVTAPNTSSALYVIEDDRAH